MTEASRQPYRPTALEAIKSNWLLSSITLVVGYAVMGILILSDDLNLEGALGFKVHFLIQFIVFMVAFALFAHAAGALAEFAEPWLPPSGTSRTFAGWCYVIALGALLCVPQVAMNAYRAQHGPDAPLALLSVAAPEPKQYAAEMYVNLYPEGSQVKNYRLPAKIRIEELGTTKTHRIEMAYWPNGGWLTFQLADQPPPGLELNKQVALTDTHGKRWRVELTDQPAAAVHRPGQ